MRGKAERTESALSLEDLAASTLFKTGANKEDIKFTHANSECQQNRQGKLLAKIM